MDISGIEKEFYKKKIKFDFEFAREIGYMKKKKVKNRKFRKKFPAKM